MIILSSNAKNRRLSLLAAIESTIEGTICGGVLSVAELGRTIGNIAHKKHHIKHIDRLCGNVHLQRPILLIYSQMYPNVVGQHAVS